jgi:hypothetical protein
MSDLVNSSSSWKETVYPKIKDAIFEKFVDLTQTDLRMSESQKKGFFRAYHDLVAQEPTLEEMDVAFTSYTAHFDHIPSPFAFSKHFNRFRSGIMPNQKGETIKKIVKQQKELKMLQWIKEAEAQDE